jgi:hypothetical protein
VGNPEGKSPLESPRRRWEDNIKMDLRLIGGVVWTEFMRFRIGGFCGHGNEPSGSIKCWEILEYLSDWRFQNYSTVE